MSVFMHGPWLEARSPGGNWTSVEKIADWPQDYTLYRQLGVLTPSDQPASGRPRLMGQAWAEHFAGQEYGPRPWALDCFVAGTLSRTQIKQIEAKLGRRRPNPLSFALERMIEIEARGLETRFCFCADR